MARALLDLAVLLVMFEVPLWGHVGAILMCVVSRDCPPILSGPAYAACAAANLPIDCEHLFLMIGEFADLPSLAEVTGAPRSSALLSHPELIIY